LKCTEIQKGWITQWLDVLIDTRPDLYRAGVAKYLQNTGITIPKDELLNTQRALEAYDKLGASVSVQNEKPEENESSEDDGDETEQDSQTESNDSSSFVEIELTK